MLGLAGARRKRKKRREPAEEDPSRVLEFPMMKVREEEGGQGGGRVEMMTGDGIDNL